jgi:aldose 1-epimerase
MNALGEPFGQHDNRTARLFTLHNEALTARVTDYGGILVSLEAADRTGHHGHIVLGFDDVAGYVDNKGSFGALLGRNANRISGGRIEIDGRTYTIAKNEPNATLHGGPKGFSKCFWDAVSVAQQEVVLALTSPDGDQGFPGEVHVTATWALRGLALHLTYDATTTKPTPFTMSAHPYFNLEGVASPHCLDHRVQILADRFLPADESQIPTGEIHDVHNTPLDFRKPQWIGARIREPDTQLRYGRGYDHYFILPEGDTHKEPRLAARIEAPHSGRVLEILTTQRGVQFYTGNNLNGSAPGRGGLYRQSAGFAFEPQGFPDAPNRPSFPSTILRPGERYHEEIVYRLSIAGDLA